jgi:hypothetical protein
LGGIDHAAWIALIILTVNGRPRSRISDARLTLPTIAARSFLPDAVLLHVKLDRIHRNSCRGHAVMLRVRADELDEGEPGRELESHDEALVSAA